MSSFVRSLDLRMVFAAYRLPLLFRVAMTALPNAPFPSTSPVVYFL